MLINVTIEKSRTLSLGGMARALGEQLGSPAYAELGFEERLGLLVDREQQDRDNRRLARRLKAAKLRSDAVIEDVDFRVPRGLDRATVLSLAESHWVEAHRNVLVTGPTGVGKTFLACALAQAAWLPGPRWGCSCSTISACSRCRRHGRPTCSRSSRTAQDALDDRHQPAARRSLARGPR